MNSSNPSAGNHAIAFELRPHGVNPMPVIGGLHVDVTAPDEDSSVWHLRYRLQADLAALRLPAPVARPKPADGLWQHTCFEAFFGHSQSTAYIEFNFSPSGQWARYHFADERLRRPGPTPPSTAPRIDLSIHTWGLTLDVCLSLEMGQTLNRLGLAAVLEHRAGDLSYWALLHPGKIPDFHHRDSWLPLPLKNHAS